MHRHQHPFHLWLVTGLFAAGLMLALPGCGGCRRTATNQNNQQDKEKDEDEEKEKPKPDFEFKYKEGDAVVGMTVLPGDVTNGVKPGHWMSLSQPVKANNFDFAGELSSAAVDNNRRPLNLERTPYRMQMTRPVALPKGQRKHLEITVFLPRREKDTGGKRANLLAELRARNTGRMVMPPVFDATTTMEPHQYYLVALAKRPAAYTHLKLMPSIKAPAVGDFISTSMLHYRVALPSVDQNVPLPSNPLLWTSIAYVIWDDIDPDKLSIDQQDALVDWLHWGGSLIISGPGSLATLKDSFLAKHLPALPGDTEKLTQDRFDELNEHFTMRGAKNLEHPLNVVEAKPPEGVKLKLRPGGQYMEKTGELLAERQIGAGRIVVTSFSLTHPQIVNWRNFDGFFNACLLRRPARRFYGHRDADAVGVRFAPEGTLAADQSIDLEKDPRLTCGLRYFTRDMGLMQASIQVDPAEEPGEAADEESADDEQEKKRPNNALLFDRGFQKTPQSGVGGWNDLSGASRAARDSLKSAAGISVPQRSFVLRVLAIYLLVLVPVNWMIFKLIGRVEWAWIAAPIIAIGGAFWVIHAAQLDIGFARSRTEVAVLEMQGDHPRGHLTRYMALYTSLSTGFDVEFDSPNALAQPFATDPDFQMVPGQTTDTVTYRRDSSASLRGFHIASNSTSMMHTEEQRSFGGPLVLKAGESGTAVINNSDLTVKDTGVVRRTADGQLQVAWVGELPSGATATLQFGASDHPRALLTQWEESTTTMSHPPTGEVSLLKMLDLARDPRRLLPGDVKLIGWTDEELGGIELRPRPRQIVTKTLVVANLQYQQLAAPTPDLNTHDAVDPKQNREGRAELKSGDEDIAAR